MQKTKTLVLSIYLPDTHCPFEDDGRLIDGLIVGDVGSIDGALVGPPTLHFVCFGRGAGRTGTNYIHRHHTELIGSTYRGEGQALLICLWGPKTALNEALYCVD